MLALALLECSQDPGAPSAPDAPYVEAREPCADRDPLRKVFYGDLHVHTTNSFDANIFGVRTTPAQAYRFAKGDPVALPPLGPDGTGTRTVRLSRPLDFAAVTDHSEFLGEVDMCTRPGSPAYGSKTCETFRGPDPYDGVRVFGIQLAFPTPTRFPDLCGDDHRGCASSTSSVWERAKQAAANAYDRSSRCSFTSFVAYEYSGATGASTLHRNVIFRTDRVPEPTTYFEQPTPQGLWGELDATCRRADKGCDVLAIPHNSNQSNGRMFRVEYPGATGEDDERAQATLRGSLEPLVEIYQHKGASECRSGLLSGAPDEQCDFEKATRRPETDCGAGVGNQGSANGGCFSRLDFVRGALLSGIQERERMGVNPLRLGIIASTDTHNGTPGYVDEDRFGGHRGVDDDTAAKQLGGGTLENGGVQYSPGGLVAVWAEENSRPSIFDALKRRETFGTSGPRMVVRFFGGWSFPPGSCGDANLVANGYAGGVPMGGILAAPPPGSAAPVFVVSAMADVGTPSRPGAPLERLQIVKGWLDAGKAREQVFDVAGSRDVAPVDTVSCAPSKTGPKTLCAVWSDPTFDRSQSAYYYVRVLESPTCRWSAFACNAAPAGARPAACDDPSVPRTVQERAWSSPIWVDRPR